jgi:hypothetical protein
LKRGKEGILSTGSLKHLSISAENDLYAWGEEGLDPDI